MNRREPPLYVVGPSMKRIEYWSRMWGYSRREVHPIIDCQHLRGLDSIPIIVLDPRLLSTDMREQLTIMEGRADVTYIPYSEDDYPA